MPRTQRQERWCHIDLAAGASEMQLAAVDLAPHEAELRRLMVFLDLSEGFTLGLAECSLPSLCAALVTEVQRRCASVGIECIPVDLATRASIASVRHELAQVARDHAAPEHRKPVMMVRGIEAFVRVTDPLPPLLVGLNLARDAFVIDVPLPIVLCLPQDVLTALSRVAPDFWSWRSTTLRFPTPVLQAQCTAPFQSPDEADLLLIINEGLSREEWARYDEMKAKRDTETLTAAEHQELVDLSDTIERMQAHRMRALSELARLRHTALDNVMAQLGIQPRP